MAHRVCLQAGGNPREWLESISDEDLKRWHAYWRLEPWGSDYERTAMLCRAVDHLIAVVTAGNGVRYKLQDFENWMPGDWVKPLGEPEQKEPDWSAMEMMFGAAFKQADQ